MSDSVLDRIRQNRQRPAVPTRDDTLITRVQQTESDQKPETIQFQPQAKEMTSASSPSDTLEELKAELRKIPETNRHSAVVLEKELDQILTRFCKDNRITLEVFLESAWVYASSNPDAMESILTEAKRRYSDRKKAGKLRRLITMLEGQS
jgi:DNA polymerase III sliding clamp (beta) subunit (PCNA family)